MQRIMAELARDTDGTVLGTSLATSAARIDLRIDGSFYLEASPILERDDLEALRAMIDEALRHQGGSKVVLQY